MKRLFLAINIPEDIKDEVGKKSELLESILPGARYESKEKWHFTIVFLGDQPDEMIVPIIEAMRTTVMEFAAPKIYLTNISYGPMGSAPKMVWLNGSKETSEEIYPIKIFLEDELIKNGVRFKLDNRAFYSHATLSKFTDIPKEDLPELGREFESLKYFFEAESLDLMESHLSSKGAKYEILQRIEFKR